MKVEETRFILYAYISPLNKWFYVDHKNLFLLLFMLLLLFAVVMVVVVRCHCFQLVFMN